MSLYTCTRCRRHFCCCQAIEVEREAQEDPAKTFYRVRPVQFRLADQARTSYAIEECRIVATSKNEADATHLVERLNEWRRLKRENELLRHRLEHRDTGKIELFRVENMINDEVEKLPKRWPGSLTRDFAKRVIVRIMSARTV